MINVTHVGVLSQIRVKARGQSFRTILSSFVTETTGNQNKRWTTVTV